MKSKSTNTNGEGVHRGHRKRMKNRIRILGGDGMSSAELLEMMLYYVNRRCDTRKISESLLSKFGSVYGILQADEEELMDIEGLGESGAQLIKIVEGLCGRYNKIKDEKTEYDKSELTLYLANLYKNETKEIIYLLLYNEDKAPVDNKREFYDCIKIGKSSSVSAEADMREITQQLLISGASAFIITHNHPTGEAIPTEDDIIFTKRLRAVCNEIGIKMYDHIIISPHSSLSLIENIKRKY